MRDDVDCAECDDTGRVEVCNPAGTLFGWYCDCPAGDALFKQSQLLEKEPTPPPVGLVRFVWRRHRDDVLGDLLVAGIVWWLISIAVLASFDESTQSTRPALWTWAVAVSAVGPLAVFGCWLVWYAVTRSIRWVRDEVAAWRESGQSSSDGANSG